MPRQLSAGPPAPEFSIQAWDSSKETAGGQHGAIDPQEL